MTSVRTDTAAPPPRARKTAGRARAAGGPLVALAVALAVVRPTAGLAEVRETLRTQTYPVRVIPGKDLRDMLNAASPIRVDGQIFHGQTRWFVRWNFRWWREADGRCRITRADTRLEVEVTMPAAGDPELRRSRPLQAYLAALDVHEIGHVEIGRRAAGAIDRGIHGLPEMPGCDALSAAVTDLAERQLQRFREEERSYDRNTGHGRTQGASIGAGVR
ncbi:MAG: DUF922 domain-containing protein [Betaproteobacteria bacterium]